jgi:peptidoglycan hydrolase FlgJ
MSIERLANTDFQSLHELKRASKEDPKKALPLVAKQFEGIFLQTMLKTMRMGSHFVDESSPFRGRNAETFQEMLDGQYVSKMINSPSGIGIADMLTKQLGGSVQKSKNAMEIGQITTKYTIPKGDALKTNAADVALTTKKSEPPPTTMIDDFVSSIWSKAKQAASLMGLDPKILIAQAALETGWGQSVAKDTDGSSSNNLFNIKSGNNKDFDSVNIKTTEYIADTPIKMSASFRKYTSIEDSFTDYVSLIKNNDRYHDALAHAGNPELYVNELSKAGYATDPNYGSKILSIYHSDELNQAMKRSGLANQI